MAKESCADCVYFRTDDPRILRDYGYGYGLCGFGPPVLNAPCPPNEPRHPPVWPVVAESHWCPLFRKA